MNADRIRLRMSWLDMARSDMIHIPGLKIYFGLQQIRKEVFVS